MFLVLGLSSIGYELLMFSCIFSAFDCATRLLVIYLTITARSPFNFGIYSYNDSTSDFTMPVTTRSQAKHLTGSSNELSMSSSTGSMRLSAVPFQQLQSPDLHISNNSNNNSTYDEMISHDFAVDTLSFASVLSSSLVTSSSVSKFQNLKSTHGLPSDLCYLLSLLTLILITFMIY